MIPSRWETTCQPSTSASPHFPPAQSPHLPSRTQFWTMMGTMGKMTCSLMLGLWITGDSNLDLVSSDSWNGCRIVMGGGVFIVAISAFFIYSCFCAKKETKSSRRSTSSRTSSRRANRSSSRRSSSKRSRGSQDQLELGGKSYQI